MLYFAYGSNLHPARLQARIGRAELVSTASVRGRRLAFHKRGQDGSGKCDATRCGLTDSVVHGALYRIDAAAIRKLDRFEGRGHGYEVETVCVSTGEGDREAMTYLAQPAYIDETLQAFGWYRELVVAGARFHHFPEDYIARIVSMACMADPDERRDRANLASIQGDAKEQGEAIRS